jgi:signal-transduction protein with cAMP-binding, CBS, and nucleotidyltransferase domain
MFSSVRYAEHVRNAINIGVHTITAPWKVMKALTDNNLTALGTQQFVEHTKLMTVRVKDVLNSKNPIVSADTSVTDALVKMTEYGFGSITVTKDNKVVGVFTDGDLRRKLQENGREILTKKIGEFQYKEPVSIDADALLNEAADLFKKTKVDTILVTDAGKPVGMLDIQDLQD